MGVRRELRMCIGTIQRTGIRMIAIVIENLRARSVIVVVDMKDSGCGWLWQHRMAA